LSVVKATALKQPISKFYPHVFSKVVNFYIYDRPLTGVGFVAAAVSVSMATGGCRAIRTVSLLPAVTVDVPVAVRPAVL